MRNIDIERFVTAQDEHGIYDMALQEVKDGRKLSHWMWFVFPQIEGWAQPHVAEVWYQLIA